MPHHVLSRQPSSSRMWHSSTLAPCGCRCIFPPPPPTQLPSLPSFPQKPGNWGAEAGGSQIGSQIGTALASLVEPPCCLIRRQVANSQLGPRHTGIPCRTRRAKSSCRFTMYLVKQKRRIPKGLDTGGRGGMESAEMSAKVQALYCLPSCSVSLSPSRICPLSLSD